MGLALEMAFSISSYTIFFTLSPPSLSLSIKTNYVLKSVAIHLVLLLLEKKIQMGDGFVKMRGVTLKLKSKNWWLKKFEYL